MASISEPVPLVLNLSTAGAKVYASDVLNCKNEAVLAIDGEGLFIHSIAPSRALSAFSTGPEVKFLCSPISIRLDSENTVTFAVTEEKGNVTLLRWTQTGVEYSTQKMQLSVKKSATVSLHSVDDSGECVLVNYNNTRLECVEVGSSGVNWTWTIPNKVTYVRTFTAKDTPVPKDYQGHVLLIISEQVRYYSLLPTTPPSDVILSQSLAHAERNTHTTFDISSGTIFQLSKKELHITKPVTSTITFRLPSQYSYLFPLSTSHVLLVSPEHLVIYDITYGTIQTTTSLPPSTHPLTIVVSPDTTSFHLLLTSSGKPLVIPLTIPPTSTLLSILTNPSPQSPTSTRVAPVLLASKRNFKPKEVLSATKELFKGLKLATEAKDARGFDKLFKEFRRRYKVNRGSRKERRTKLTPVFVKELMALVFTMEGEGVKMTVYPEETIKFLLDCQIFSRDALPGKVEDRLVQAALSDARFLLLLLETEPTPFQFRDFLVLTKKLLESSDQQRQMRGVSLDMVFEALERNVERFFDMGDMKSVLSTDNLHTLLDLLTSNNSTTVTTTSETPTIQYPALLTCVLDSIGLAHLFLPSTLPPSQLDFLLTNITTSTEEISSCLSLSSILSLALKRHNSSLTNHPGTQGPESKKRKRSEVEIVAEEGGGQRRRQGWLKRDLMLGQGSQGMTKRLVAQKKFLEVPSYSLDRMVL